MSSGQPPANRESDQSQRLVFLLANRKKKKALPDALSLFNIGRLTGGFLLTMILLLVAGAGNHNPFAVTNASSAMLALSFIYLPFLLMGIRQGAHFGLYGLAEFISGLSYTPMRLQNEQEAKRRTFTTLGLIYSGTGRLDQALRYFSNATAAYCPFAPAQSSAWNERDRQAELLHRLGRQDEAWVHAQQKVEKSRRPVADLNCRQLIENLQCDLLVSATIGLETGNLEEALTLLKEASGLGPVAITDFRSVERSYEQSYLLSLYSRGLLHLHTEQFDEAAKALEECSELIKHIRLMQTSGSPAHSELLSFAQYALGQSYIRSGCLEKLPDIIKILKQENMAEPPLSVDILNIIFLEVDYHAAVRTTSSADTIRVSEVPEARESARAAIESLEKAIEALGRSGADHDRLLLKALDKYKQALLKIGQKEKAESIAICSKKLRENTIQIEQSRRTNEIKDQSDIDQQMANLATKYKLPNISTTKNQANRTTIVLLTIIGYTLFNFLTGGFNTTLYLLFPATLVALAGCVSAVREHVHNYRARACAIAALSKGESVTVVLKVHSKTWSGLQPDRFVVVEGPQSLLGRTIAMGMSDNLITIGKACNHSPDKTIKARLYLDEQTDKIIAAESLGRVLTVKKEIKLWL